MFPDNICPPPSNPNGGQNVKTESLDSVSQPLQVGDRVRLTSKYQGRQFTPGEAGTIVTVLSAGFPRGMRAYQVRLDDGEATLYPAFYEEELERE